MLLLNSINECIKNHRVGYVNFELSFSRDLKESKTISFTARITKSA